MLHRRAALPVLVTLFTTGLLVACSIFKDPSPGDGAAAENPRDRDPNAGDGSSSSSSSSSSSGSAGSSGTSSGETSSSGTSSGGANGDGGGGDASSSSGTIPPPKTGDPRWALGPVPADAPAATGYTILNNAGGVVVVDKVTSLMWQDAVSTTSYSFDDAQTYCDGLSYGGYTDWRAPTRIELASLASFSQASPLIAFNTPALSGITQQCVWSASRFPFQGGNPNRAWYLENDYLLIEQLFQTCAVRCVRNAPPIGSPIAKQYLVFIDTITDAVSGLIWERNAPTTETSWADAKTRCEALVLGGHAARLPTIKELLTLVDETKGSNPISASFSGAKDDRQWTAIQRWAVSFNVGQIIPSASLLTSRCVASL